jgi:hypothetical protein
MLFHVHGSWVLPLLGNVANNVLTVFSCNRSSAAPLSEVQGVLAWQQVLLYGR